MPEVVLPVPEPPENLSISFINIIKQDLYSTVPILNSFFKAKFSVVQDVMQCTFAFVGATAAMTNENIDIQAASLMTAKMILSMSTSRAAFNLLWRSGSAIHSYVFTLEQDNPCVDIINEDILSVTPYLSSCFKAKFSVAQDIGQCVTALGVAVGVMYIEENNLASAVTMTVKMMLFMVASRAIFNGLYRCATNAGAILYSYARSCENRYTTAENQEEDIELMAVSNAAIPHQNKPELVN